MRYNPHTTERYAETLEAQANTVVVIRALLYGLVLGGVAIALAVLAHSEAAGLAGLIAFLVGAIIGTIAAQSEALKLRILAQTILLLIQLEQNTRERVAKGESPR